MLKIQGLKKKFGNFEALSGLDMEVEEGALYGFVGPNGAGKTTAIRIITGLLKADEGTVMIGGKDAFLYSGQVKNEFGYVPDEFGLYDNLKVWEYMDFFASCYGLSGLVARERCTKLLEQVKLAGKEEFFVDSLSRGMKQRLCLARAMIHDPKLLVLDEPTSGMDPRARIEFKELLKELCAEGKTIVVSSHILSELAQMCTDIGIIDAGDESGKRPLKRPLRCDPGLRPRTAGSGGTDELDLELKTDFKSHISYGSRSPFLLFISAKAFTGSPF